ncbi:MAG: ribonuclease D [Gammaproteobacteria bacterium]|nr:ribonuclease D [Gammaproteobacteria bacterium]
MEIELITTVEHLQAFCTDLAKQNWLVLDTEFIRETTYYPNLCLIQIANDERAACIDTLAIDDLSALQKLIYSDSVIKVFHAASQDLEIFFNLYESIPTPIFDTQIAASALGYGEQVSYAYLVSEICDVSLDKSLSRTAWDRRPLSKKELQYAVDDVIYLAKIYHHLRKKLGQQKRSHWVQDEFQHLCALERYKVKPSELWKSVKGVGKLESHQLIVLKQLAEWRDQQAIEENKPRQWILRDKSLRALAIEQPTNTSALSDIEELSHQQLTTYAKSIFACIQKAQHTPEQEWPDASQTMPLSREQRKIMKQASQLVREKAEELNIAPTLLAKRSIVEKLLRGQRELHILHDWRQDLIGNDLVKLFETHSAAEATDQSVAK